MPGRDDDDFWLSLVDPEVRDRWAAPAPGPTLLETARAARTPDAPLPDAEPPGGADGLVWAPGALAGVLSHHVSPAAEPGAPALALVAGIDRQSRGTLDRQGLMEIYEALRPVTLGSPHHIAMAASTLAESHTPDDAHRFTEAAAVICGWLVCRGTHRGPVKAGLAAASLFTWAPLAQRAAELGRLNELSAEAAIMLRGQEHPDEEALLGLAEWHSGWGRIHAVEALLALEDRSAATDDWLATRGWYNTVDAGYTAPLVVERVDVASRVLVVGPDGSPSRDRLATARELLSALLNPYSPGATLIDLPGSVAVVDQWFLGLSMLPPGEITVEDLALAWDLQGAEWSEAGPSWAAEAEHVAGRCTALLQQDVSRRAVEDALTRANSMEFGSAVRLAPFYALDPVPALLDRLSRDPDDLASWSMLASGHGPRLGVALVDFAVRVLPTDLVSETTVMPGAQHRPDLHAAMMYLWSALRDDAATGWRIVEAMLASRAASARSRGADWMAALPAAVVAAHAVHVRSLIRVEPDAAIRERLTEVLASAAPELPGVEDRLATTTPEVEVLRADRILCWQGPTMGMTVLTASQGALILTTSRLVFRTSRERTSRQLPLPSLTSCVAAKKRALVVSFRDEAGVEQSLTFGRRLGMPELHRWVGAINEASERGR